MTIDPNIAWLGLGPWLTLIRRSSLCAFGHLFFDKLLYRFLCERDFFAVDRCGIPVSFTNGINDPIGENATCDTYGKLENDLAEHLRRVGSLNPVSWSPNDDAIGTGGCCGEFTGSLWIRETE